MAYDLILSVTQTTVRRLSNFHCVLVIGMCLLYGLWLDLIYAFNFIHDRKYIVMVSQDFTLYLALLRETKIALARARIVT